MKPTSWEQAKDVITEALKRAPSEREQFVREQCADAELAGEIITLLAAYRDGADFLADPPTTDEAADEDEIEPGTRVGPYVIIDSIGRGGMGHVFLGSDPRLRRKVALKCVIRSLAGSGERRLRILHEARAAARVAHPNVATIHDVVEHDNRAFIVMEYVEGESLASRMKRERVPIDRVIAIGRQLASALSAAHAKGVVHRDLKPSNVHFTVDGSVKVLDFGIANAPRMATTFASRVSRIEASVLTTRGVQPGTPPYMSPEQLAGNTVDERSDIYSLGVVLFEMATGRRPYRETDAADLKIAIANGPPRANSVDPRVPPALADVIARALAVDVDARYQTAAELGAALEKAEGELTRRHELIGRKAARVAVGMLMVPAGLAGIGITTTSGFNLTFGRTGAFASEPWTMTLVWGFKALLPSAFFMIVASIAVLALRVVVRVAAVAKPVGRSLERLQTRARGMSSKLGLDDPSLLAQGLAGLASMALLAIIWRHGDLIQAWMTYINIAPPARLELLGPDHVSMRGWYRIELDVLVLCFGFGLYRVAQLRRVRKTSRGRGSLLMVGAIVTTFILLNEWPYRTFYHNEFERVDYAGARCYITGDSGLEFLIFCPEKAPPRNQTIRHDDAKLRRLGIVENVFTGVTAP